jgi:tRNA pseudouridine38-40 synthase
MRLRLDLAYDGAPFHGFARQPDLPTVQGALEDALGKLAGRDIQTTGAGRTDAGVHALGQVVSVPDLPDELDLDELGRRLNTMCGPAIAIQQVLRVAEDFDARFSARSRTYVYALSDAPVHDPFLARTVLFHRVPLNVDLMNEAAGHLIGHHDFASFGRVEGDAVSERMLLELRATREGHLIRVRARANAFIQQMVRSLVGTLIHVGEGRLAPDSMAEILAAKDRASAGPVAPPHGLCLVAVEYDEGWARPGFAGAP